MIKTYTLKLNILMRYENKKLNFDVHFIVKKYIWLFFFLLKSGCIWIHVCCEKNDNCINLLIDEMYPSNRQN